MVTSFLVFCFLTAINSFLLGLFVFLKGIRKSPNRMWGITSLSVGLWSLGLGMMVKAENYTEAIFWLKTIHYLGALFIPVTFLHYVLALVNKTSSHKKILIFLYCLTILLQFSNFKGSLATVVPSPPFNYYTHPQKFYIVFTTLFFLCVLYLVKLLINEHRDSKGERRNQIKYMLIATLVGFSGGSTAFFPVFNIPIFPYGIYIVPFYPIIMTYAILKHHLLDIKIVFSKIAGYSIAIISLSVIFVIIIFSFSRLFGIVYSQNIWILLFIVTTLALIFQPIYRWSNTKIDKLFFKGTLPKIAEELQKSEKLAALGILTSGLAHEIKNPLAPIKAYIQNLPNNADDKQYIDKISKIIPIEIDKITDIINQLRDFANPPELSITKVNKHNLIDKRFNLLEQDFIYKKISIERKYSSDISEIRADPIQLERVFLNLFLNAIDAMPNGGKLMIFTETTPDNKILIKVSDTGMGIEKEDLSHIFDPFYSKGKHKGMGIGLAVVQQIIKNHNGNISVATVQGKGTSFCVFLPFE